MTSPTKAALTPVMKKYLTTLALVALVTPVSAQSSNDIRSEVIRYVVGPCGRHLLENENRADLAQQMTDEQVAMLLTLAHEDYALLISELTDMVSALDENRRTAVYAAALKSCRKSR